MLLWSSWSCPFIPNTGFVEEETPLKLLLLMNLSNLHANKPKCSLVRKLELKDLDDLFEVECWLATRVELFSSMFSSQVDISELCTFRSLNSLFVLSVRRLRWSCIAVTFISQLVGNPLSTLRHTSCWNLPQIFDFCCNLQKSSFKIYYGLTGQDFEILKLLICHSEFAILLLLIAFTYQYETIPYIDGFE